MIDDLRRLADADPMRAHDPAPREDLLEYLLTQPRPARRRRLDARLLLVPAAAGIAALAITLWPSATTAPSPPPRVADLAAAAYARTTADPDEIVHTRATFVHTEGDKRETGVIEDWHRGAESHRIERYYTAGGRESAALDHVIDAEGVMRQVDLQGGYRIVRRSDNEDAENVIDDEQRGFVEQFRRRYERGQLDPSGDVQFAGRPARRYLISPAQDEVGHRPPGPEQAYYIDRETAEPLGLTSDFEMMPGQLTRYVLTVETLERLAPTEANLERLRTHILPRRRDQDGCIRGPVTSARTSDSASKRDCGGTPGATVDP